MEKIVKPLTSAERSKAMREKAMQSAKCGEHADVSISGLAYLLRQHNDRGAWAEIGRRNGWEFECSVDDACAFFDEMAGK